MIVYLGLFLFLFQFNSSAFAEGKGCIAVIPAGTKADFWNIVAEGARKAGRELGVEIYFRGSYDEKDEEIQKQIIYKALERGCKGMVIAPNSPSRTQDVDFLKKKGVSTVYIDRSMGKASVLSLIETDNYEAGKKAGEEMIKALKGRKKVAILRLKKGITSTDAREKGFLDVIHKAGLNVVVDEYLGTTISDARKNADKILSNKKSISYDGIFTPNEITTLALIVHLKTMKKINSSIHIGFDYNRYIKNAIEAGTLHGVMIQRPFEMGYQGVKIVHQAMKGTPGTYKRIDTGSIFISKENINDPDMFTEIKLSE